MDTYTLLVIGHVIGAILGVGAATFIEIHLNMGLSDRRVIKMDFFVSRIGLLIAFLTGLGFVALYISHGQWFKLYDGVFWAKMTIVGLLVLNATLLHLHKIGLYWGSALSFISWWVSMILGMFLTNNVKIIPASNISSYIVVMFIYGVLVIVGAWLLHKIREYTKAHATIAAVTTQTVGAPPTGQVPPKTS